MASYPKGRSQNLSPYFAEVMSGFEYTAAVRMIYEGMEKEGLACIRMVRDRYDGCKRNPFDKAECGLHYARAMASWASILALTGFHYSAVTGIMTFAPPAGRYFWSTGFAWSSCQLADTSRECQVRLKVHGGILSPSRVKVTSRGDRELPAHRQLQPGEELALAILSGKM